MKIIKRGSLPANEIEVTCSRCKSILRGLKSEFKFSSTYLGTYYEFTCPVCKNKICTDEWNVV